MRPNTKITDRIDQKYREICRKVWKSELDFIVTRPKIECVRLGTCAGEAAGKGEIIRLNCELLNNPKYTNKIIDETFPHEFAHIVVLQH